MAEAFRPEAARQFSARRLRVCRDLSRASASIPRERTHLNGAIAGHHRPWYWVGSAACRGPPSALRVRGV